MLELHTKDIHSSLLLSMIAGWIMTEKAVKNEEMHYAQKEMISVNHHRLPAPISGYIWMVRDKSQKWDNVYAIFERSSPPRDIY